MKLLDNIKEWIDDNIIWYVYDKPKSIYKDIRGWFRYCYNKPHYNLVKNAFLSKPYDGCYLEEIIQFKLEEMYNYFKAYPGYTSKEKYNDINRWLSLAIKLANIVNHEYDLYDYEIIDGKYRNWSKVKVNLKNKDRFAYRCVTDETYTKHFYSTHMYDNEPWALYREKAKRLLYRILSEKAEEWWD